MAATSLRSLKDRPFELLLEMERRALTARAGQERASETGREWVGVAFRIGDDVCLAPREQVREVLMLPAATPVPGAISWLSMRSCSSRSCRLVSVCRHFSAWVSGC